jgi:hypothetical protein
MDREIVGALIRQEATIKKYGVYNVDLYFRTVLKAIDSEYIFFRRLGGLLFRKFTVEQHLSVHYGYESK